MVGRLPTPIGDIPGQYYPGDEPTPYPKPSKPKPPPPSAEPPPGVDFDPWGGQEGWERAYAAEHGGLLPGMPGAESWESAMASLAWSQQYAAERGGVGPTQQEWERQWYESQGWDPTGGDWRAWIPGQLPTPWWQRVAEQMRQAQAMAGLAPEEAPLMPGAPLPERGAALPRMAGGAALPGMREPTQMQQYLATRAEQLQQMQETVAAWEKRAREQRPRGAGGAAMPRMEFAVSPGYPAIMDPAYRPSTLEAGEIISSAIESGTLPYVVPEGVVRYDIRVPAGREGLFREMRNVASTRWEELRARDQREHPQAWEAALDITAAIETGIIDYIHESQETLERAKRGEERRRWTEQLGVPYERVFSPEAQAHARQIRALTNQIVVDVLWDWPVAVCTKVFDRAWGMGAVKAQADLVPKQLSRLRELEAMGLSTPKDYEEATRGIGVLAATRLPFDDDDYLLLMHAQDNRAAMEEIAETGVPLQDWQDVKDLYQSGRLGWTCAKHPERLAQYLQDLRDPGFDMGRFVEEYEDQKAELIGAILNPLNFAIPASVDRFLFPAGYGAGKVIGLGLEGAGKLMGKIPVLDYLTAVSKRSKLIAATDEAYDVTTMLVLRTEPEGISKADTIGRLMLGDEDVLRHLPESTREKALEVGTRLHEELTKRKKSAIYHDLWEWVYPGLTKGTDDPAILDEMVRASDPSKVVAQAYKRAKAAELGIKPAFKMSRLEKKWRYAGSVLKENWLSLLGSFHLVNDLGDRTRQALRGLNPLRFPSQGSALRAVEDYGLSIASVERTYMDDIVQFVAGEPGPTARLPVPGLGKPRYAIDALKDWLGFEVSGKGPLPWAARVTTGVQPPFRGTLGETIGKGWVWLADHANLGSLNDVAGGYGAGAEALRRRSAMIQFLEQNIEGAGGARSQWLPGARAQLDGLADLSPALREALERDLKRAKNPTSIRQLADKYLELPDKPIVFQHLPAEGPVPIDTRAADYIMDQLGGDGGPLADNFNAIFDDAATFYRDEYRYLLVDGVDEATSMHKFIEEYYSGLGDKMRPKDVDLAQKIRVALTEDKLSRVRTMYDVPETYMMARVGDVAEHGETTGIFDSYFKDKYLTVKERKAAAKEVIRAFNAKEVTQADIMEATAEAYSTMLDDMGAGYRYEYGKVVRITGEPGKRAPYQQWIAKHEPMGKPFMAVLDPSTKEWHTREVWDAMETHADIVERAELGALGDMTLVAQDDTTRAINIRGRTAEDTMEAFARLEEQGVPPGTPVDMMWSDPVTGRIEQRRSNVGGVEPTAAQQYARPSEDPLALANDAVKRKEMETFARETGTEIDFAAAARPRVPSAYQDWLTGPEEDRFAALFDPGRAEPFATIRGKGSAATHLLVAERMGYEDPHEAISRLARIHQEPGGTLSIDADDAEAVFQALPRLEELGVPPGTKVNLSYMHPETGELTWVTEEFQPPGAVPDEAEATVQAWNEFNKAMREEWRLDIERRVDEAVNYVEDWRDELVAHAQRYNIEEWKLGKERERLVPMLEGLANEWSELLEKARARTVVQMNEVMFDYSRKSNFERMTEVVAPFTTYQYRSIPFFAKEAVTNWRIPRFFDLYDRYTEMEREKRGLPARFKGTFPVPFQEQLQERGMLPEGYWAADPKSLMLWQGSLGEPFETPGEQRMEGGLAAARAVATAPEQIGVRYWPWLQMPLEMAGVYGPRETGRVPWQMGGVPSRLFPQAEEPLMRLRGARPFQAEDPWQDLAETMRTPSQENWVRSYNVAREIAGMIQQGVVTEQEGKAAQFDTSHPLYQEVAQRYDKTQRGISLARLATPFGIKHATPAELSLREAQETWREEPGFWPPAREAYGRAGLAAVPREEREAKIRERDRRSEYLDKMRKAKAHRDRTLADLRIGTRPYEEQRKRLDKEIQGLVEEYSDVSFGEPESQFEAVTEWLRPENFKTRTGEIDWERYERARAQMTERMGPEWGRALEQERVSGWTPQRVAGEPHEARLREGAEEFFTLQPIIDRVREMAEQVAADRTLDPAERRRQEQMLWDQINALQAQQAAIGEKYGPRSLGAYRGEVAEKVPGLDEHEAWRLLEKYPMGAGMEESWLRGKDERTALERTVKSAFYDLSDVAQRDFRRDLDPAFAEWLRGEATPSTHQIEEWAASIPGARQKAQEAGVTLRRYEAPSDPWMWTQAELAYPTAGEPLPAEMGLPTPERTQQFATASQHMREWRLGQRQEWSSEMQTEFGTPDSPKSEWFTEVGRVFPYIDWEGLNQDRDASALLSGNVTDDLYEQEAARGFPTLMKYVDQAALGAEVPEVRKAADAVEMEWPKVPEELSGVQTQYFGLKTGYDRNKWKEQNPDQYAQLQGHWNAQMVFQWENPEYTFVHRPENFRKWWGDMTPEQVRTNLGKNVTLVKRALSDMSAYQTARTAGEQGEWTNAMSEVFEDPGKESVKFWNLYHQVPPSSWGQPMKEIEHVALLRSPVVKKYFPTADIPDDFYIEAMQLLQEQLNTYNADPNVPHWESEEEVDQLWDARDRYFRIRNWEEAYPAEGTYDPDQFLRDNPVLTKWYPYFTEGWWTGRRPMNPYATYGAGDGGNGGGEGEGGVGPPPTF